jgi:hypothetical protein
MAGYLFNCSDFSAIESAFTYGVYGTRIKTQERAYWGTAQEGAFADYLAMKESDSVYFFSKRKIYGIGSIISKNNACVFLNYPNADIPDSYCQNIDKSQILLGDEFSSLDASCYPIIVLFEPSPFFFKRGVDIDEALFSNPSAFRMIRANSGLSFVKIDDEENQALKDIILKSNKEALYSQNQSEEDYTFNFRRIIRNEIYNKITSNHVFSSSKICELCHSDEKINHEMAIEADIGYKIVKGDILATKIFGTWDHIAHQVIASPFKPIIYIDKIDIFGYTYLPGFSPTIEKYLIIEVKKDIADVDCIEQVMKYVDFVNNEYCHGDFSMIEAYCVAYGYTQAAKTALENLAKRIYLKGIRPSQTTTWNNLRLIQYRYSGDTEAINYTES